MDTVDHYHVLGLPSGEEGALLSEEEIKKAFRLKALELHPDKRRDDPNAHANFQQLNTSYGILKDRKTRKLFDDMFQQKSQHYSYEEFEDLYKSQRYYYDKDEDLQHYYDGEDGDEFYESFKHVFCQNPKVEKVKRRDLKYDIFGWIILVVGIATWVGIAKSHVPAPPR